MGRSPASKNISLIENGFVFCNHYCIVFELLGPSILHEIEKAKYRGLSLKYAQAVLKSILPILDILSELHIIHSDIKPENILQEFPESKENFKLIDFGCCMFENEFDNIHYIQSRFYRAPEVLLHLPYDSKIDIWSLGCVMAEIVLGLPLLPGQTELHLISLMNKTIGKIPCVMSINSPRNNQLFLPDGALKSPQLLCEENDEDFVYTFQPYFVYESLHDIIMNCETEEERVYHDYESKLEFLDLIEKMLIYEPEKRISEKKAMDHPFMRIQFQ